MSVRRGLAPLVALTAMAVANPAAAEVTAQGEGGFATTTTVLVAAEPAEVWAALIEPGSWWSKDHSWFGDDGRFSLAPVAGGCFCETTADGEASVEHMRVLLAIPARQLRLRGSLGPLQADALTGVLTVSLEPAGDGTRVTWDYVVSGFARFPLDQVAPAVDVVLTEQLNRLQAFVETGAPTAD
jgi:uncharacterized protein YndB with AHSA1/START domain